jgi:hypothetical protein
VQVQASLDKFCFTTNHLEGLIGKTSDADNFVVAIDVIRLVYRPNERVLVFGQWRCQIPHVRVKGEMVAVRDFRFSV